MNKFKGAKEVLLPREVRSYSSYLEMQTTIRWSDLLTAVLLYTVPFLISFLIIALEDDDSEISFFNFSVSVCDLF